MLNRALAWKRFPVWWWFLPFNNECHHFVHTCNGFIKSVIYKLQKEKSQHKVRNALWDMPLVYFCDVSSVLYVPTCGPSIVWTEPVALSVACVCKLWAVLKRILVIWSEGFLGKSIPKKNGNDAIKNLMIETEILQN